MIRMLIQNIESRFFFKSRPEAIPADLRPLWRIAIITLILHRASRGGKSTVGRLHVINWAIRTKENMQTLINIIEGKLAPDTIIARIEPSLNRAVDLAHGEGLIERPGGDRISLTAKGQLAAESINKQADLFVEEKRFLKAIGKSVTEQMVQAIFAGGNR